MHIYVAVENTRSIMASTTSIHTKPLYAATPRKLGNQFNRLTLKWSSHIEAKKRNAIGKGITNRIKITLMKSDKNVVNSSLIKVRRAEALLHQNVVFI